MNKNYSLLTTPYSGTHLIMNCLSILRKNSYINLESNGNFHSPYLKKRSQDMDINSNIYHNHLPNYNLYVRFNNKMKLILLIRNPLDYILRNLNYTKSFRNEYPEGLNYELTSFTKENLNNFHSYILNIIKNKGKGFILPENKFDIKDFLYIYKENIKIDNVSTCINTQYILLQYFDNYKGDKKIILYDDFIKNKKKELENLELFFDDDFKWDIDYYFKIF